MMIVRVDILLADTDPPIRRRVEVAADTTLTRLHTVIQAAMGWQNAHLHKFDVRPEAATLAELAASGVRQFGYVYDFGDSWEHAIRIGKPQAADPAARYPRLVEAIGRSPPEDCGGIPGFYNLIEALADPKHPEHDDLLDWHGGPFDPAAVDVEAIRARLAKLGARRRPAGGGSRGVWVKKAPKR